MDPVREQDDDQSSARIDPDRGAGEAGVAEAPVRKPGSGAAFGRRSVPSERPARAGYQALSTGELPDRRLADPRLGFPLGRAWHRVAVLAKEPLAEREQ